MNVEEVNSPGYDQPKKSGRSWCACFGIGCVVLFLLCAVGGGATYFFAKDSVNMFVQQFQLQQEAIQLAMESEAVIEKLGEPITQVPSFAMPETTEDGAGNLIKTKTELKGSNQSGDLYVEFRMEPGKPVVRTQFYLEVDGEQIDLMDSDPISLDVDDGDHDEADHDHDHDEADHDHDDDGGDAEVSEEEPVGAGSEDG